jgi:hypothetical protein
MLVFDLSVAPGGQAGHRARFARSLRAAAARRSPAGDSNQPEQSVVVRRRASLSYSQAGSAGRLRKRFPTDEHRRREARVCGGGDRVPTFVSARRSALRPAVAEDCTGRRSGLTAKVTANPANDDGVRRMPTNESGQVVGEYGRPRLSTNTVESA